MQLLVQGAAREVTGSCHVVQAHGKTILLDCGMFQGRRSEVQHKNLTLPVPIEQIDAVVLSHAHIDHSGRLPLLVRNGYKKAIHATRATVDLCEPMLMDSAHIQEKDAEHLAWHKREHFEPLYGIRDAERTSELMVGHGYDERFEVAPGVFVTFTEAGHILGSASIALDIENGPHVKRFVFSGDIGRSELPIIRDPNPPENADWVLMESTYGNRDHGTTDDARVMLAKVVRETAARGGRVLVPAFAVGRTQELVYDLHQMADAGEIPRIPIYIDSPLATHATSVFERNADFFDQSERFVRTHNGTSLFQFPLLRYTPDREDSKALSRATGPMIVISASGMAESGRIVHHLQQGASDPRNTIMIVGFQAEHTLGRRIVERRDVIKTFGVEVPLRAQVSVLNGYSAHADRSELLRWVKAVRAKSPRLKDVFLVHGEPEAQEAFAQQLRTVGFRAHMPTLGERITLG
ncbi:MAG: MBL fold metallo-hydrolase [Gemmatimonadaceae bacterium]|nr:MBL fold metallo-hydrolase [Gemmatimonadaceae bacterium]